MEAVQGTHLYGRRLVIEVAAEEGGLDELRAKTAAKFSSILGPEAGPTKRGPAPADADAVVVPTKPPAKRLKRGRT